MPAMRSPLWVLAALLLPLTAAAADANLARLQKKALDDPYPEFLATSLVSEVGPRFAGSDGYERAVIWALQKMQAAGLKNIRAEPVIVPHWQRGETRVELLADSGETVPLNAVALGGSVGTLPRGIEAEVIRVESLDALKALKPEKARGRIIFMDWKMPRTRDASGYRDGYPLRSQGAVEAGKRGAAAYLLRSLSTADDDAPHTGALAYGDAPKIPALALSNRAADRLAGVVRAGGATLSIRLLARELGAVNTSYVIGEIPGASTDGEVVLIGAHLDSWDITPGAEDDAAGVAIALGAARILLKSGKKPRRTIRIVLFANEEFGLSGARAYAETYAATLDRHALALEADLGSGKVWRLDTRLGAGSEAFADAAFEAVAPLGVAAGEPRDSAGADLGPLAAAGVPALAPRQDATRYFDVHHAATDTLDHLDREGLRQNVAVYASLAWLAANGTATPGRLPAAPP